MHRTIPFDTVNWRAVFSKIDAGGEPSHVLVATEPDSTAELVQFVIDPAQQRVGNVEGSALRHPLPAADLAPGLVIRDTDDGHAEPQQQKGGCTYDGDE
jgi:hypothetical protein